MAKVYGIVTIKNLKKLSYFTPSSVNQTYLREPIFHANT